MFFQSLILQSNIKTWQISIVYTVYATKRRKRKNIRSLPLRMEMRWNFPPWITETGVITVFQYYQNIAVIHFVFSVKFQSASLLFFYVYFPYLTTFPFILLLCKYLFRHRYTAAHKNICTLVEIFCQYIVRSTMFHHFDDHYTTLLFIEGTKYLTQYLAQWLEKNLSCELFVTLISLDIQRDLIFEIFKEMREMYI